MPEESGIYIYGKNPIFEYIAKKAERINKIFIKEDASPALFKEIKQAISVTNIQIASVPLKKLNRLVGKDTLHQGVVAEISPVEYLDLESWLLSEPAQNDHLLVILDSLQDPHNFGAIIRTAVAAGAAAILIGTRDQVAVNGTVIKTSSGLAEDLPIVRVHNLNQAMRRLKEEGYFITGTQMEAEKSYLTWSPSGKTGLLIGSEGKGARPSALAICDDLIHIPMAPKVESLNASVTAALLMYEWKRNQAF